MTLNTLVFVCARFGKSALTVTLGASDTPSPQENFGFGRNLVQVDSIPTQVTTT